MECVLCKLHSFPFPLALIIVFILISILSSWFVVAVLISTLLIRLLVIFLVLISTFLIRLLVVVLVQISTLLIFLRFNVFLFSGCIFWGLVENRIPVLGLFFVFFNSYTITEYGNYWLVWLSWMLSALFSCRMELFIVYIWCWSLLLLIVIRTFKKACKPFVSSSKHTNGLRGRFGLLSIFLFSDWIWIDLLFQLLQHIIEILVGVLSIVNHNNLDCHHVLFAFSAILVDFVLSLLECNNTFVNWLGTSFFRESENSSRNSRYRNWFVTLTLAQKQQVKYCLS